jgi:hypothetical protein
MTAMARPRQNVVGMMTIAGAVPTKVRKVDIRSAALMSTSGERGREAGVVGIVEGLSECGATVATLGACSSIAHSSR